MPSVSLQEAEHWAATLGPALRKAAVRGLRAAALRGVSDIVSRIIPKRSPQPVDRGVYRAGWKATNVAGGADIENLEPHSNFIEYGVRASNVKVGRAMIDALAAWAQRKRIVGRGKRNLGAARSAAWAIAKSMQRRGIFNRSGSAGLGVLKELVDQRLDGYVREEVEREIARELKSGPA